MAYKKKKKVIKRTYDPHPTIARFHASGAFHRGIMGPRGSGKSTGCTAEIFTRAMEQNPNSAGVRPTRWTVVRNTYRELEDTTIKTWLRWISEDHFGPLNRNTMTHHIKVPLPDGTRLDTEVLFRALDRPGDVKKALSLEITGAWVNEAREIPYSIIMGLDDAIGRFPDQMGFGVLPTWRGMIMDTNPPDDSHWWFKLCENKRLKADDPPINPSVWQFFKQPGGLVEVEGEFLPNPEAENLKFLEKDFYLTRMQGKSKDHIRIYYCNQYGFLVEGRPVHEEYVDATHCSHEELEPVPDFPIYVGLDFGLTPAAVFGQIIYGRWYVLDELVSERIGIKQFCGPLGLMLRGRYRDFECIIYGDPAGSAAAQTDERTPYQILEAEGIAAGKAWHNNDSEVRREALHGPLTRMVDGKPGMLLSPRCKMLRKALSGGYHYKKVAVVGEERFHEKPNKNQYSHVAEACEYMVLGAGEGTDLLQSKAYKDVRAPKNLGPRSIPVGAAGGWML